MAFTKRPGGSTRPGSSSQSRGRTDRPRGRSGKPFMTRRKSCRFCADKIDYIDFKNVNMLRNFIMERGKMLSGRSTGVCAFHQRGLGRAIKLARNIALIPFAAV